MKVSKLATRLKRAFVQERPKREVPQDPEMLRKFKLAEEALRKVEVPGYGVNIVDSGVVKLLRLTDDERLIVFLDYFGSDPACYFCRFLNNYLWSRIINKAKEELKKVGFTKLTFMDYYTGFLLEEN